MQNHFLYKIQYNLIFLVVHDLSTTFLCSLRPIKIVHNMAIDFLYKNIKIHSEV